MKFLKFLIIIFFIININFLNAQSENLSNKITKNLRCLICQGQSVYDSDSEFANSLKILVNEKLNEGLKKSGCEVYRIGLGPTPMLYFASYFYNADGAIQITGSHNPKDYNGFKLSFNQKPFFGKSIKKSFRQRQREKTTSTRFI